MGRLTFVLPAVIGGVFGIALAASHERLGLVAVLALVAMVGALAAQPLLLRELTHVHAAGVEPPYQRVRDEVAVRSFRGPSVAYTRDLLALAGNAYDLHFRFRPVLIGVVSDLLAVRARVDLHDQPEQARALVGSDLWELVRPDRPVPEGRFTEPGLDPPRLHRLLDDLERITL